MQCHYEYFGPIDIFQNPEMAIIGNYVFCICCNSAIDKLIIVNILLNEFEVDINLLEQCCRQAGYNFNDIVGNIPSCLFG